MGHQAIPKVTFNFTIAPGGEPERGKYRPMKKLTIRMAQDEIVRAKAKLTGYVLRSLPSLPVFVLCIMKPFLWANSSKASNCVPS